MANPPAGQHPVLEAGPGRPSPIGDGSVSADHMVSALGSLLRQLQDITAEGEVASPAVDEATDNQLVQVRLGAASSLFAALRCKHASAAGHSLRVALSCSAWASRMSLDDGLRDAIEVAALLHDVGVIGVPDQILLKPAVLDRDEATVMARSRMMGLAILRHSCSSPEVLEIVEYVPCWYDGSRQGFRLVGEEIPLGARIIAVVEAFDAMITDHVYRPAMSRERAMSELFDCAGRQFDPELVRQFAEFHDCDPAQLHREVARCWLRSLDAEPVDSHWELNCVPTPTRRAQVAELFQAKLLDNMYDAVLFIDAAGRVALWNHGAERLTGIAGSGIRGRRWQPDLLRMSDEKGALISPTDCPATSAIRSGVQSLRRLTICGRTGRPVTVDTHAIPVIGEEGATLGAILLFHDASSETSLEQRCQNLHEKATKDPLTQVANRAEFDRVHAVFVNAHQQEKVPCSLIICDLDRFKRVNDTYGHQAGDDAIKSLAALLKNSCRPGDLVARYGGEEFVVLCADCDNATATRRAEEIRTALSQLPQAKMDGRPVTASFGVTEIQPGDTPETMLRRSDRALLKAKAQGRNTVVQLGSGSTSQQTETRKGLFGRAQVRPKALIEQTLGTPVPVKMAVEKLRGFVADHQASIIKIDDNLVQMEIYDKQPGRFRRLTDRPVTFHVDLRFEEERLQQDKDSQSSGSVPRTKIHVTVGPKRSRDRRRADAAERARQVMVSLRSYLMATEEEPGSSGGALTRAKRILTPWKAKK